MEVSKRLLGIYLPFVKSEIQMVLAYRVSFFSNILVTLLNLAVSYYLWLAIFNSASSATVNGFTKSQMLTYIIISFITARTIGSGTEWIVGREVQSGEIAINLIRPINYRLRLAMQSIGKILWQFVVIFLPVWICMVGYRYFISGESLPNIWILVSYLLSLIFSFTIWFLFNFCFGLMAFFVTYIWGLNVFKNTVVNFLSGAVIPIMFFPLWFQKFLMLLPFSSINYTPVMIYLNKYTLYEILEVMGIQILWIVLLYLFSEFVWRKAIKKLTIMGG